MVFFPNCKINLGLNIVGKRTDGYHDLETFFYPVQLRDAIEVIERPEFRFSASGLDINGNNSDNLCVKAYDLLKKDFPGLPPVHLHLHKALPIGAGLGGGSADGAFTLKLLNKKFKLELSQKQLINYASQLGSDCPFFIINKPCYATGRGEILEETAIDLSGYKMVLVHPGILISTAWAFGQINPCRPVMKIKEIIRQPVDVWKEDLRNDFEQPVFNKYPEIKKIKDDLYAAGAVYAAMSGSGSTVYGIFPKDSKLLLSLPREYFIKEFGY
ncbi:MAG TPA: 4-(cytidine 5'-diphospho)-2-C-methyl-D-erythritol kinase [Chitinophagaceae bacterium]|nr:4-(cytidine 5'-diphospho)-2-C-methyl-D-erythritol kinase [Chitinophagaceae bacterium]